MDSYNTTKIPVTKILIGSFVLAWLNKGAYSKALALPTLVLVLIWAISTKSSGQIQMWLVLLLCLIGFSIFAVTCHRLILTSADNTALTISLHKRVFRFSLWVLALGIIYYFILALAINFTPITDPETEGWEFFFAKLIASIPAFYVIARLSLVFPSTAIDRNIILKQSWHLTRNNGWRIAIIVGLFPWLISMFIWLVSRADATIVEKVLVAFLYYFGTAIEVFALSLTYKEIMKEQPEVAVA